MLSPCPNIEITYKLGMNTIFEQFRLPRSKLLIFENDNFSAYAMCWQKLEISFKNFIENWSKSQRNIQHFKQKKIRQQLGFFSALSAVFYNWNYCSHCPIVMKFDIQTNWAMTNIFGPHNQPRQTTRYTNILKLVWDGGKRKKSPGFEYFLKN